MSGPSCSCAWAHRCKRRRLDDRCCCACAFRRTTLSPDGDFDRAKEALRAHIHHLVEAGQSAEATSEAIPVFEAEIRSAAELWGAGCRTMDDDLDDDEDEEEEAAWATECAAKFPPGRLATVAQQGVARARSARPPLDPSALASGLRHLPCAKCESARDGAGHEEHGLGQQEQPQPQQGGAEEDEVLITEEKNFEEQQHDKLQRAKQDSRSNVPPALV